ncbi:MAG: head GIN domain-containing protein [Bacteroidales bacterium]
MKTKVLIFNFPMIISLMLMMVGSQVMAQKVTGSRNPVAETRQLTGFDGVKAGGAFNIFLTQGSEYHVEVIADDNLIDLIETTVEGGVLEISMRPRVNLRRYKSLEVHITAPSFSALHASGACDMIATNTLRGDELVIRASGASDIEMDLKVAYLDITCSGASDAILSGQIQTAEARFSGASDLKAKNLECSTLHLKMSGSSDAHVSVTDEVSGSLSGSSDLTVIGRPVIDVRTSGSASVSSGR